jgi:hypothetical protein
MSGRYDIKRLNEDLKRDLAAMPEPKVRVRGHRASEVHGEAGLPKAKRNRQQRRTWKQGEHSEEA